MFQKLLEKVAISLDKHGITYMVIGGQAILLYGEPRLTRDVDITLGLGPDNVSEILDIAGSLGWKILVDSPEKFVTETMVLPCLEQSTGIRIDFVFSLSPYEKQALNRVKRVLIGKTHVCFASVEDIIIHKIVAGRPRDIEDARKVLIKNQNINTKYIRRWLEQFDKLLSQSFLSRFKELWKATR